ncbi:hypothetical protein BDF22DRAFT_697783 [Syncephalis plumigaleata]|nr:hypothetical protein BDF22DRAFT_697783 [Syncephalis plumigaleata]
MLTGPITCLQWSFAHDDQPRRDTAFQLTLAIRDEPRYSCYTNDEPTIREGLPLHRVDCDEYLNGRDAFLLSSTSVP